MLLQTWRFRTARNGVMLVETGSAAPVRSCVSQGGDGAVSLLAFASLLLSWVLVPQPAFASSSWVVVSRLAALLAGRAQV
jgi:hypothetical protein